MSLSVQSTSTNIICRRIINNNRNYYTISDICLYKTRHFYIHLSDNKSSQKETYLHLDIFMSSENTFYC